MTKIYVIKCDGCNKLDGCVVIQGKNYCKPCFDERGFNYQMMDHVEENKSNFEALGMEF
ncbi:MAG: hypothetical protein ACRD9Q_05160 [Nitrososphaeraceae archaeon]